MAKNPLRAYWWSPKRSATTMSAELKHHVSAWMALRGASRSFTNFGDELSPLVLEAVTGRRIAWAAIGREDVVAVGSVIAAYLAGNGRGYVWGSGLNRPLRELGLTPPSHDARFVAVRGPMSRSELGLDVGVPVGDPGLLANHLVIDRPAHAGGAAVIPHFTVYNHRSGRKRIGMLKQRGYRILSPNTEPREMLRGILSVDRVYSSGLHGVILAHSMDRPGRLIDFGDHRTPASYKYLDYYASVGSENPDVAGWSDLLGNGTRQSDPNRMAAELDELRPGIERARSALVQAAEVLR